MEKYGRGVISHVLFHFDKKLSRSAKDKYKKIKSITQAENGLMLSKAEILSYWLIGKFKIE